MATRENRSIPVRPHGAPLSAAISLALVAMGGSPVLADEAGSARPAVLEEVEVYGHRLSEYRVERVSNPAYTADLLDTARTVNVITAEMFTEQGADTLSDILSNVPGISMQAGEGGTPAGDQLSIRGFSARTDIFVDGVRDFGGYSRDSYNVDRVEVAKGPGSNYQGRGSTGGSINLVSKTAREQDFLMTQASLGAPDFGRATLDVNRSLSDHTAARLNLMVHDAEVPGRDEVENERFGIAPTVTFGLGTDTRFILGYSLLHQENVPDYGIPWVPSDNTALPEYVNQPAPVDDSNWYGLLERDYEEIDTQLLTVRFEHDFAQGLQLSSQFRWGNTDRDSITTAPRFISSDSTDIRRTDWKSRDQQDRILNALTVLTGEFHTGGFAHSFAAGVELSDEFERNYGRDITGEQPVTDLFDPSPADPWGGTVFRTGAYTDSDGFSASGFVADTVTLSPRWLVTAGLRWDRFELDYANVAADGTANELARTDSDWSYQASVVYKPLPNGSIYAGYGTSFNPSGEGLTLSSRSAELSDLEPEKGRSIEIGTKWELLGDNLLLSAAWFRTEKTDARETDPVDSSLITLSGKQVVEGLELGVVGRLSESWNVAAGYTWMDSEISESVDPALVGNDLANTPRNTFSLWLNWQALPNLEFGIGTQFVDERYSNTRNDRIAPDYQLYNAMLGWAVNDRLGLRVNAFNLADEDYIASVGGGHVIPGEGRSVVFSVDFAY
ncbi:TonB-dependent receptor [Elongatibacter sediminis]|uniref:TonB-dependent siderophore receptor n=1 Tax=Elongatibacter sediminis TaxID=3119006 RepID=A0AAW9RAY7_9GAMM